MKQKVDIFVINTNNAQNKAKRGINTISDLVNLFHPMLSTTDSGKQQIVKISLRNRAIAPLAPL